MGSAFELTDVDAAHEYLASFERAVRAKGEAYFRAGAVLGVDCIEPGTEYSARVQGSRVYQVDLFYDEADGWDGNCSCPMVVECKHLYAALKSLLAEDNLARVQALSSAARRASGAASQSKRPEAAVRISTQDFIEKVKASLGRPLSKAESVFLVKLDQVYARCGRSKGITPWEFADLGFNLGGYSWDALQVWPAFPEDIHTFWLYLAHTLQQHGLAIPGFLAPVTDLSEIQERLRRWRRAQEIDRWRGALSQLLNSRAAFGEPEPVEMDLRARVTAQAAHLEGKKLGQDDFKPIAAKQARQFYDDYFRGRLRFTPQADVLWHIFQERLLYGRSFDLSYRDSEALKVLNRVVRHGLLQDRVVTEASQPFCRAAEPLRWAVAPLDESNGDYHLNLVKADGSKPPPLLFVLDGRPPLYVSGDTIYAGPPIQAHLLDPARENCIPAPALETVAGVQFLEHLRIELPPRIRDRVQRLPIQVTIQAELYSPYPEVRTEYCLVRISAQSGDGKVQEHWDGFSWVNTRPAAAKRRDGESDDRLVFYDRTPLAEVPRLIEPLELKYDGVAGGLVLRLTRKFPETFAAWLRTVPPHIRLELKGELASLASDAVAGTLRLEVAETEIDWFDLKVVLDVTATELTPEELRLLLNGKGQFVRLRNKGWMRLQFNLTEEDDERLARLGLNPHELTAEPQRLHALQLADESARKFLPAEQADQIQRRASEIKARVTPPLPAGLTAELRPYQVEGFHFLAYLAANRFGGILADDMGLGKTLQALAWLLWLRTEPENATRPALVVCPKSVMDNWCAEAKRFAAALRVKAWPARELDQFLKSLPEADVHVLNYSQMRMLGESLVPIRWLAVVLDEGQYVKNPSSQTAQVARALHASHRLVLSGTPIENRLMDLWSLMAFTMPGVLGSRHSFGRLFDAKTDPLARRRLSARVRPFLLRRTKAQVAKDLPDKIEEDLFCEIEGEQLALYRAELKFAQQLLLKIQTQKQLAKAQFNFLTSLLRLRQICCHPALVKPDSKAESAKVNALLEQLEPLMEEGQRVLVFSQFVELLDLLKPVLEQRDWPLFYLTGSTENRGDLVQRFQTGEGPAVFLISLKAGGFGLNLTAASYVILFDPWWNPAVETQAIDRTHRIGQEHKVIAYRLLIKDSVEEKIRALQRQKSQLAEDVLGEEKFSQSLTLEDLHFLLAD